MTPLECAKNSFGSGKVAEYLEGIGKHVYYLCSLILEVLVVFHEIINIVYIAHST